VEDPERRQHFLASPFSPDHIIVASLTDFDKDSPAAMSATLPTVDVNSQELPSDQQLPELQAQLRKLERLDWWLWSMAVIVMLLLTFAVFTMSFPGLVKVEDPFFQSSLNRAVRGLIGLVLIFNSYTIYQQITVKKLRRDLFKKMEEMRILQVRAEEFERLSQVDSLTGLSNRRFAEERLAAEAARCERYGHPLTVIAFDLDKFKEINDTYGHPAGDQVLKAFARRLESGIRKSDTAARMGGDEFLILLPECDSSRVQLLLDRMRPMETEYAGTKISIRFSAGWVGYERGETTQQFLERADRTLYAEKRSGKARAKALLTTR
jgi:diguanylate cyclase (GGDEF)-like protein